MPSLLSVVHTAADCVSYHVPSTLSQKSLGMLKKLAWQRRWFEVTDDSFSWYATASPGNVQLPLPQPVACVLRRYASAQAAQAGDEPLGRVPLGMVLTALPVSEFGGFEVDLGNRRIQLAPDGVGKAQADECVRRWVQTLASREVVGAVQDESCHRKKKPWKVERSSSNANASAKASE